ncbi:hypothetical protein J3R82DRAFT_9722 [Butyriboletus roseoflavus]|nr:hypothetical protein J3R82DRAFT_9722 [Butyriboletus roseoflavus]
MAGGMSHSAHAVPLAAPRPGYPAPVANLKISSPLTSGFPLGRSLEPSHMGQVPRGLRVARQQADTATPRMPPPIYQTAVPKPSVPSMPHPLQPPMTPITPVFARPSKSPGPADVKFSEGIMRGNSEDNLLPKRGERGDDFWRRFSMVAKEEKKPSSWLTKTQNGTSRLSRWVWTIGMALFICAGIGIGLWYYISHNSTSHQQPTAVGGSASETADPSSPTAAHGSSSSAYVTPTFTLARRDAVPEPSPTVFTHVPSEDAVKANVSGHNKKHRLRNF